MIKPNPQAVEAAHGFVGLSGARAIVKAAEPHIRSQLLTELAEEFDTRAANIGSAGGSYVARSELRLAANRCRELAAKEERDG